MLGILRWLVKFNIIGTVQLVLVVYVLRVPPWKKHWYHMPILPDLIVLQLPHAGRWTSKSVSKLGRFSSNFTQPPTHTIAQLLLHISIIRRDKGECNAGKRAKIVGMEEEGKGGDYASRLFPANDHHSVGRRERETEKGKYSRLLVNSIQAIASGFA